MVSVGAWVAGARVRTLPASVVPVIVGTAASEQAGMGLAEVIWWRFGAALLVAVAIQVGVNYANDYSDGVRGTDAGRVGPMRLVASGAASAQAVRNAAIVAFGIAAVAGVVVAAVVSWWLVPVGAACFAAAWLYTGGPWPYGYKGLGELSVLVFFGLVATGGSAFVQDAQLTSLGIAAGVPVGLGAVALLIVNNLRDVPTDRAAGKRTLAVRMGEAPTRVLYLVVLALMFGWLPYLMLLRPACGIAIVAVPLAVLPARIVLRGATGAQLNAALAGTARTQLVYGALLAVGLVLTG